MKIELIQREIVWEEPESNFAQIESQLTERPPEPGSLVVLAEMFAVGFTLNLEGAGDSKRGPTCEFMKRMATRFQVAVVGSFPLQRGPGEKGLNRLLAVSPAGEVLACYDKIHPFSYGKEADHYAGGNSLTVFEYGGWKICPTICYDLRFPEVYRRATLEGGAEMFLVVANWPSARREHWRTLLRARAIENQCVVVAVNRTGQDPNTRYSGDSMVVDEKGELLLDLADRSAREAVEVSRESMLVWREKFPALADATYDFELIRRSS